MLMLLAWRQYSGQDPSRTKADHSHAAPGEDRHQMIRSRFDRPKVAPASDGETTTRRPTL